MALRHATRDSEPLHAANLTITVPSKTWNTHATASLNHLLHEAIDKVLRILEHNKPPPTQDWQVPSQRLLNIIREIVLPLTIIISLMRPVTYSPPPSLSLLGFLPSPTLPLLRLLVISSRPRYGGPPLDR